MPLETGTYISDLVVTNPAHTDQLNQDDGHMRLVKSTLKTTFPSITGAVTATHTALNTAAAGFSSGGALLSIDGTLAAPGTTFANETGTGFQRIGAGHVGYNILGAKVLDIAAAGLGVTGTLSASGAVSLSSTLAVTGASTFTGVATFSAVPVHSAGIGATTATTPATADNSTSVATTAYVQNVVVSYAPLASPALTGTPTAPTPTAGDNTTKLATTAFVTTAVSNASSSGLLIPKALVSFTVSGGVVTVNKQFNITSVTRTSAGKYTINFTNAMPDANYAWFATGRDDDTSGDPIVGAISGGTKTSSSLAVTRGTTGNTFADVSEMNVVVYG